MTFQYSDGGRLAAGFTGKRDAGDCATRAISIATGKPYAEVYAELFRRGREFWGQVYIHAPKTVSRNASPRGGVADWIFRPYLEDLGWQWTPTMHIGSGCEVHLRADELPSGRLIVRVSRHLVAVVDGVIHDTHDPSNNGTRCVYGYWREAV
jgi:hypothetical protein